MKLKQLVLVPRGRKINIYKLFAFHLTYNRVVVINMHITAVGLNGIQALLNFYIYKIS